MNHGRCAISQKRGIVTRPDLSVVIVSWNVRQLLEDCLRSLHDSIDSLTYEVVVVDNASSDGSAGMVRAEFPDVRLIANLDNVGFGRANNQALRVCQGRCVLFPIRRRWTRRRNLSHWRLIDVLPAEVLSRRKAKFWQGAGVGDMLAQYAGEQIADDEFRRERTLPNGWVLNTKEELMYYRVFSEHFGEVGDLSWMGRTKGAPRH